MKRAYVIGLFVAAGAGIGAVPLIAQESEEQQKSAFLGFVEDRISAPGRRISINGLEGALSSDVAIEEITISDDEGVWLRIENAQLNWNQAALLTGRLQINSLTAESIDYPRPAMPPEGVNIQPESGSLDIPEFPVAINIDQVSVPSVSFGEAVFGLSSEISLEGSLRLEGGSLDTDLEIARLDGPGGALRLDAAYDGQSNELELDFNLAEPANGVVANLLQIADKPALTLDLSGAGPLDALETELTLDASSERVLTGVATLSRQAEGLAVRVAADGPVSQLVAEAYRPFLGAQTEVRAEAVLRDSGGVLVEGFRLAGGQFSIEGSAETTSDGFLSQLDAQARIADASGAPVVLPVPGGGTSLQSATVVIEYGADSNWNAQIDAAELLTGGVAMEDIALQLTGAISNPNDPASRRVTFNADGGITGISAQDPEVAEALGESIALGAAGMLEANQPLQIAELRVVGRAVELVLSGEIEDYVFDGDIALATTSIAPFSGLAGRSLSGGIRLSADGELMPLTGGFDLMLDGQAQDLELGVAPVDAVLAGQTSLSGRVARTEAGFVTRDFEIANTQVRITADGRVASDVANFEFNAALEDLALVSDTASGPLSITGKTTGTGGLVAIEIVGHVPQGRLADKPLRDAEVVLTGTLIEGDFTGALEGDAFIDGHRAQLRTALLTGAEGNRLSGLEFSVAGTRVTGDLIQNGRLLDGAIEIDAPDISNAAALALLDAEGSVQARVQLAAQSEVQNADVSAELAGVSIAGIDIGTASLAAQITDLFGVPVIDGRLNGQDIAAGGVDIAELVLEASRTGDATNFTANAALDNGATLEAEGDLAPVEDGYRIGLQTARLRDGGLDAVLAQPTGLTITGDVVALDPATLNVGGGRITASGTGGDRLDIAVDIADVPLSVANAIQPELGLAGTVSGTVSVTGAASAPVIGFDIAGRGIDAAAVAPFGVAPFRVDARGSFADGVVQLAAGDIAGAGGLSAQASGRLPLTGSGGALSVQGSAPLSLANRTLGARGAQASGTVTINAQITGSLANPSYTGRISTANAEYVDPLANIRLTNIRTDAVLSGDRLVINSLVASLAAGGSVSASGSVGLTGAFDAAIDVRLASARYADGNLFVATVSGGLNVSGPLLGSPRLSGDIVLERAEISVPDLAGGDATLIEVEHVAPQPAVRRSLQRARGEEGGDSGARSGGALQLNVRVSAPNQVFVRGRGLDAELGGSVTLTGSINAISPVGGFDLIRGRMSILGQRITFDSGRVTLVGDLDPYIDLRASTPGDDVDVFITVIGPVSDLDVEFTSDPELPQDEVLSQLIFKRTLGDLSPLQLARLAAAAGELVGSGDNDLMNGLRAAIGLDDIDIITDDEGNTAVRAGSYIQDNVYVSVEAGAQGESRVSLDLDLTDDIKARGSTATDGETSIGIFYESDF